MPIRRRINENEKKYCENEKKYRESDLCVGLMMRNVNERYRGEFKW